MSQSIVWSFITEYQRVLGHELKYLELLQSETNLKKALKRAEKARDIRLRRLVNQLYQMIATNKIEFLSKKSNNSIPQRSPKYNHSNKIFLQQYSTLLKRLLQSSPELTMAQREELDTFRRRKEIDENKALLVEQKIRQEYKLPKLNWEAEVNASVHHLLGLHAYITDTTRLLLMNTYVNKKRVGSDVVDRIIAKQKGRAKNNGPKNESLFIKGMTAAAMIIAITLVSAYFLFSDNNSNAEQQVVNIVRVHQDITTNTTWHSDNAYHLESPIFVEDYAQLTIEPGTKIYGEFGSALIVTKNARLLARGQSNAPIIFSSAKKIGQRQRRDWGGIVLLGDAPINQERGHVEGIDNNDQRGHFGGSNLNNSCGILEYTRIEFGGFEVFANNELNGLTLGGCGQNTVVRNVQVHMAADDGIEIFGGSVNLKNIVITGAKDDSLDWDMGWNGLVQFLIVQQYPDAGENAIEGDNWKSNHDATPRSSPTLYNITLIGSGTPDFGQRALNLRRGTGATIANFLFMNFSKELFDIRDPLTAALARTNEIRFSHGIGYKIGKGGDSYFGSENNKADDDGGFDEALYLQNQDQVKLGTSPLIPDTKTLDKPQFIPNVNSPLTSLYTVTPQDEFWDETATYSGAVRPGAQSSWYTNWAAFPQN